jgi:hypothetical protein
MRNTKLTFFVIGVVLLFSLNGLAQTKKLTEVGRFRLMDPNMAPDALITAVTETYAQDIKIGFTLAGYPELYTPFVDQVKQAAFVEQNIAVGDTLLWMVFRSQGKVKLVQDLEWAGKEPLPVYSLTFTEGNRNYEVVIPKACGNVSLRRAEPIMPEVGREQEPVQEPEQEVRDEIRRAKIYDEIYAMLSDTDLYCSFRIHSGDMPDTHVIGAERAAEKAIFSDGDVIYVNKGKADGLEEGQVFLVLDIEKRDVVQDEQKGFHQYGALATKKGRARILNMDQHKSTAVLEKCCDAITEGSYLVPFEPEESLMGKDLGFDVPPFKADGVSGEVIYLQTDLKQIASGGWGLINIGQEDDLHRGQQLVLYRELYPEAPLSVYGNVVVIDVQEETATIKVLSCRDAIQNGDLVMLRPTR